MTPSSQLLRRLQQIQFIKGRLLDAELKYKNTQPDFKDINNQEAVFHRKTLQSTVKCYGCGGSHFLRDCPKKASMKRETRA